MGCSRNSAGGIWATSSQYKIRRPVFVPDPMLRCFVTSYHAANPILNTQLSTLLDFNKIPSRELVGDLHHVFPRLS